MNENIFTEIYNKILSLFGQQNQKDESKNVAVNRLRVVLMQDRTNLTPEILGRMRKELIELLSKYLEMDKDALELNLEQEGEQMALMLSIPVIRAKDEEEIEAAIKAEQEAKENNESEESEESVENEDESEDSEEESEESVENEDESEDSEEESEETEESDESEEKEDTTSEDDEKEESDEDLEKEDSKENDSDSEEEKA